MIDKNELSATFSACFGSPFMSLDPTGYGELLRHKPCIPAYWASYKMNYRYRETVYHITVTQTREVDEMMMLTVDGIKSGMTLTSR